VNASPDPYKGDDMKKRGTSVPQPNYVRKLHYLWTIGALPRDVGVHQVSVSHDDWCGIWQ
jgi:hypothetical protein